MDRKKVEQEHYLSLYRFAWALCGDSAGAIDLTRRIFREDTWHGQVAAGPRATEVALFTAAFRAFAGGKPLPAPLVHDRVASLDSISFSQVSNLSAEALLDSFSGLELPQRAALVLFYTTNCTIHDISAVLHQTHEATVATISRGKAEWLHILHRHGAGGPITPKELK